MTTMALRAAGILQADSNIHYMIVKNAKVVPCCWSRRLLVAMYRGPEGRCRCTASACLRHHNIITAMAQHLIERKGNGADGCANV